MDIEIDPLEELPEKYGPVYVRVYAEEVEEEGADAAALLRDPQSAARFALAEAVRGSHKAQVCWAHMLLDGYGVARDAEAAYRWFQIAARGGDPEALNMVGRCHELGWGVPMNTPLAAAHYRTAAAKGHAWAQFNLASLLTSGNGVAQDYGEALRLLVRSARQDNAKAMNMIGRFREEGWDGRRPRLASAASWYRRAAHRGCFRGRFHHARFLYAEGQVEEAARWLAASLSSAPWDFRRDVAAAYAGHPEAAIRQAVRAFAALEEATSGR